MNVCKIMNGLERAGLFPFSQTKGIVMALKGGTFRADKR